jgi:arylmalonate decarboxylase
MAELAAAQPIGARAKIGVIVPVSNTVNEAEFNRMAPGGVSVHFTRAPLHADPGEADFGPMLDDVAGAVSQLATCKVDLNVFGCTADSMACPADRLIGTMEDAGGVPGISTAGALVAALNQVGAKRLAMATPYTDETNEHEKHYLEGQGFDVVAMKGLDLNTSLENIQKISRVKPQDVYDHACAVNHGDADALLICCTDFNTLDVIEPLEQELGKPVLSSNTATFWHALRTLKIDEPLEGHGRLLRQ